MYFPFMKKAIGSFISIFLLHAQAIQAFPQAKPFESLKRRANQGPLSTTNPLQVDFGYNIYEGVANSSTGLNTFKGLLYTNVPS